MLTSVILVEIQCLYMFEGNSPIIVTTLKIVQRDVVLIIQSGFLRQGQTFRSVPSSQSLCWVPHYTRLGSAYDFSTKNTTQMSVAGMCLDKSFDMIAPEI